MTALPGGRGRIPGRVDLVFEPALRVLRRDDVLAAAVDVDPVASVEATLLLHARGATPLPDEAYLPWHTASGAFALQPRAARRGVGRPAGREPARRVVEARVDHLEAHGRPVAPHRAGRGPQGDQLEPRQPVARGSPRDGLSRLESITLRPTAGAGVGRPAGRGPQGDQLEPRQPVARAAPRAGLDVPVRPGHRPPDRDAVRGRTGTSSPRAGSPRDGLSRLELITLRPTAGAVWGDRPAVGLKVINSSLDNPSRGLPRAQGWTFRRPGQHRGFGGRCPGSNRNVQPARQPARRVVEARVHHRGPWRLSCRTPRRPCSKGVTKSHRL